MAKAVAETTVTTTKGHGKELITAVDNAAKGDPDALLELFRRHKARSENYDLHEVLQTLPRKQHQQLWAGALAITTPALDQIFSDEQEPPIEQLSPDGGRSAGLGEEGSVEGGVAMQSSPQRAGSPSVARMGGGLSGPSSGEDHTADTAQAFEVLRGVVALATAFLSDEKRAAPAGLLGVAQALHDGMLHLPGPEGGALRQSIAKLCEGWWLADRKGGELLVGQLLLYMLIRSLEDDAKEADVKRVYALRAPMLLVDYDDDSSGMVKDLVLRAFKSPRYLKSTEGRRFLTCMFGLHPSFIEEIHTTIKQQLPGARKTALKAYGEVYYKAWRGAEGPYLEKIEVHCLQSLMHACVHASSGALSAGLLLLLGAFHKEKRFKAVDAMLLRLYEPILWRALRVANPLVRMQACSVLLEAFPLSDPTAGAAATSDLMQRQFDAIQRLLDDADPRVRAVAAKGTCQVLRSYWELIPLASSSNLLSRVVPRLCFDASSPGVRLAVVQGLTALLECPMALPVLKKILPVVSNMLHDSNSRVRLAWVQLLQRVKASSSIGFDEVSPMEHLMARLAQDGKRCPAVASAITKLLMNSCFPQGPEVTGEQQVRRVLACVSQGEDAALAFYSRLHEHVGVPPVTKLVVMLLKCVLNVLEARTALPHAQAAPESEDEADVDEGQENQPGLANRQPGEQAPSKGKRKKPAPKGKAKAGGRAAKTVSMAATVTSLLRLMAAVLESMSPQLRKPAQEACLEMLQDSFTGPTLALLYGKFSGQPPARTAVLQIAGLVGEGAAPELLEEMVQELLLMPEDAPLARYAPLVSLLCRWDQLEPLLAVVLGSLEGSFNKKEAAPPSQIEAKPSKKTRKGGSTGRGRKSKDTAPLPAHMALGLALNTLSYVLAGGQDGKSCVEARAAILGDKLMVDRIRSALNAARAMAEGRLQSREVSQEVSQEAPDVLLVKAAQVLGRLYLHQEAAECQARSAAAKDGDKLGMGPQPMGLSSDMRDLMVWTTDTVMPALGSDAGGAGSSELAQGLLGCLLLLSAEWLACGVGLAEISIRASTWGRGLLSTLALRADGTGIISAILPQLCRLVHQLQAREEQGARPADSLWELLLRMAAVCDDDASAADGQGRPAGPQQSVQPLVQKLMTATVGHCCRRNRLEGLADRLVDFLGTQYRRPGAPKTLTKKRVRDEAGEADESEPDTEEGAAAVPLMACAAEVLEMVWRSAPLTSAVIKQTLAKLLRDQPQDGQSPGAGAVWAHVLSQAVDRAPAKVATAVTVQIHSQLSLHRGHWNQDAGGQDWAETLGGLWTRLDGLKKSTQSGNILQDVGIGGLEEATA